MHIVASIILCLIPVAAVSITAVAVIRAVRKDLAYHKRTNELLEELIQEKQGAGKSDEQN